MAHDDQFKDPEPITRARRFDYPKKGEWYWNRHTHAIEQAQEDGKEKFLIVDKDGGG